MCYIYTNSKLKCWKTLKYSNFLLLVQSKWVNTDSEGAIHVESCPYKQDVCITEQVKFRENVRAYFLPWIKESVLTNKLSVLKGQVHDSVDAHVSKCCFSAVTCCVIYASNMIMSKNQSAHTPRVT